MTKFNVRSKTGISRPELLFLFAVTLMVLSIALPLQIAFREKRRLARAKRDIVTLVNACGKFYHEYGVWPTYAMGHETDRRFGTQYPNAEIINILCDREMQNPKRLDVLNTHHLKFLNVEGEFIDPWGMPYQVVLDTDLNNICEAPDSAYHRILGEGIVVWSCGPDCISETADDVRSWPLK